ncbi:MAG: mechanosensitive ion channel [Spirochaetia bacterium]|nr:mechanosensitive ion channel [Spirochaetia bacterium]
MQEQIAKWLVENLLNHVPPLIPKLVMTGAILALAGALRMLLIAIVGRVARQQLTKFRWRRKVTYAVVILCVVFLFPIWLPNLQMIAAFLGIFGAGVILVLKDVIINLAGWVYIVVRKPFEIGNRISIVGFSGDVTDIRLIEFTMMEIRPLEEGGMSTGRVLHIPNAAVLTSPLANSSKEFVFNWNEIHVPLDADSNWQKAAGLLEKIAHEKIERIHESDKRMRQSEEEYMIRFRKILPRVFVEFRRGEIMLTLRHLAEPKMNRLVSDVIWREILTQFGREPDIKLSRLPI